MGAQWKQAGREINAQKKGQLTAKLVVGIHERNRVIAGSARYQIARAQFDKVSQMLEAKRL